MSEYTLMMRSPPPQSPDVDSADGPTTPATATDYAEAMTGFIVTLVIYFLCIIILWKRRESTATEVEKHIVQKKVLPHGQSRRFDEIEPVKKGEIEDDKCWLRRKKSTTLPIAETAEEVLMRYKMKNLEPSTRIHDNTVQASTSVVGNENISSQDSNKSVSFGNECSGSEHHPRNYSSRSNDTNDNVDDELVLAEEGNSQQNLNNMCPICIQPFEIGEEVAWSQLGQCHHVYHKECILPWLVMGNEECPVCRLRFWRNDPKSCEKSRRCVGLVHTHVVGKLSCFCLEEKKLTVSRAMKKSRFCVIHGLVSPSDGRHCQKENHC